VTSTPGHVGCRQIPDPDAKGISDLADEPFEYPPGDRDVSDVTVDQDQPDSSAVDWLDRAVAADPKAHAAYADALAREALLDQLAEARGQRSQSEVARLMGTTQSAVSELETGRVDARLTTLQRYARAVQAQLVISVHGAQPPRSCDVPEPTL
jgi:DNA-binding XRE family transcriptional regulator